MNLTGFVKTLTMRAVMFSHEEQQAIALKAIEQAIRSAEQAKIAPDLLLPTTNNWPFLLSEDDRVFLKIQRIDLA